MTSGDRVELWSTGPVVDLRRALCRFAEEARGILIEARSRAARAEERLAARIQAAERRLDEAERELAEACADERDDDHDDDDDGYDDRRYAEARGELDAAREALEALRESQADVARLADRARAKLARLDAAIVDRAAAGIGWLDGFIRAVRAYEAERPPDSAIGAPAPSTSPPGPVQLPSVTAAITQAASSSGFTTVGCVEFPLSALDMGGSHVQSHADFRKVSYAQMVDGIAKLDAVVRPLVQKGATAEDFTAMDAAQGLDYESGYRRVFDAFYGSRGELVRVEWDGQAWSVSGGAHRIFVAQRQGLATLPVEVVMRGEDWGRVAARGFPEGPTR